MSGIMLTGGGLMPVIGDWTMVQVQAVETQDLSVGYWRFDHDPDSGGVQLADCAGLQIYNAVEESWMSPASIALAPGTIEATYAHPVLTDAPWRIVQPAQSIPFDVPGSDDNITLDMGQTGTCASL